MSEFGFVADNVVQLRDFKRREERLAARRKAMDNLVADSWAEIVPCEMPPVQPDFTAPSSDPA